MHRSRREFLRLGTAVVLGSWSAACDALFTSSSDDAPPSSTDLAAVRATLDAFFTESDIDQARRVGEVVMALPGVDLGDIIEDVTEARTTAEAVAGLHDRIALDFEQSILVTVDGWYLSRTEALVCALTLLDAGRAR